MKLNLPNNFILKTEGNIAELQDGRDYHLVVCDTSAFFTQTHIVGGLPQYDCALAQFAVDSDSSHHASIEAEPSVGGFRLICRGAGIRALNVVIPRQYMSLELIQTGSGKQLLNEAVPGTVFETEPEMVAGDEDETLFYSANERNPLLIRVGRAGRLLVKKETSAHIPVPGTPAWELMPDGKTSIAQWTLRWEYGCCDSLDIEVFLGHRECASHYRGRLPFILPDVSDAFGFFFYQVFLGTLPLNLRIFDGDRIAPRANVAISEADAYRDAWTRDTAWCYEFCSQVDPAAVATLLEHYIRVCAKYSVNAKSSSPALGIVLRALPEKGSDAFWDDAAAELLIMGGRHYLTTGDKAFAAEHMGFYVRCGEFLLSIIPPDHSLPITRGTWDGQGVIWGMEPYFTAIAYAGLLRLSDMLQAVGREVESPKYRTAALQMKEIALKDWRDGGLWHAERGTFINYIDYRDPSTRSPRLQNWASGQLMEQGLPRLEYAHYETVFPIWMGLLDDPVKIHAAYRWIDEKHTYASGRGGVTFPPFIEQTFMGLIDVCVRLKYGIPNADRLLQLILDHALDGGIPFTEFHFGAYQFSGPMNPDWEIRLFRHTHSGRCWDNAPYFGIVLNMHYGLEHTHEGWKVNEPRPIANYPLAEVRGVRHGNAVYNIRWDGQGAIIGIWVDGIEAQERLLPIEEGFHDVKVILG